MPPHPSPPFPMPKILEIVKLHSDLRILTQLQLIGVGVDFVFPLEEEEGRRKEEEEEERITLT